ncbi:hypothetical protein KBC04_03660 [Candidatus Babeliales bacterium]|nr:hypothetical protein [Candidatus Babeliales bacterium]MBP9843851.1 hypothetical protein [Candidatus Babeliales bacterium]
MKRYGALRKIMIMVLLSILGSYCIGADDYKNQLKDSFHHAVDSSYLMAKSVGGYCQKLWSELVEKAQEVWYGKDDQSVEIQRAIVKQDPTVDSREDFYLDYEKCTDGAGDCAFNEHFFGDTYYATGPENFDPAVNFDYSKDPITE